MNIDKKTSFSAVVKLPEDIFGGEDITIDVELSKDEKCLTYDEVEDAVMQELYKRMPNVQHFTEEADPEYDDCWPEIVNIVINADDGESYPVVSESMDCTELKRSKTWTKYLVLPDATYCLTPECKLWMKLKEQGIISKDAPFDFDKYHALVEESN